MQQIKWNQISNSFFVLKILSTIPNKIKLSYFFVLLYDRSFLTFSPYFNCFSVHF